MNEKIKKIIIKSLTLFALCLLLMPAVSAAAKSATATLYVGQGVKQTSPLGLATKCEYTMKNNSSSQTFLYGKVRAAWDGWPYSDEVYKEMQPGQSFTGTVKQSRLSSFRGLLNSTTRKSGGYVVITIQ